MMKDGRQDGVIEKQQTLEYIKYQPVHGCEYELCVRTVNHCGSSQWTCTKQRVCGKPEAPRP